MLKVQEIRELIKLVDQSNIDEFSYENDGSKIKMKKKSGGQQVVVEPTIAVAEPVAPVQPTQPAAVKAVEPKPEAPKEERQANQDNTDLHTIVSPMVGTYYKSPSPDADVYVQTGSKVSNDSIVCIVEAMKLFNEIEAEINGEIVEILVKDGQLVEYGQPLFLVKPE